MLIGRLGRGRTDASEDRPRSRGTCVCVIGPEEALEDREGPLQGDAGLLKLARDGGLPRLGAAQLASERLRGPTDPRGWPRRLRSWR